MINDYLLKFECPYDDNFLAKFNEKFKKILK